MAELPEHVPAGEASDWQLIFPRSDDTDGATWLSLIVTSDNDDAPVFVTTNV